jgi:OPA family glycerol-3-phosphate transporter-like MFS transporter
LNARSARLQVFAATWLSYAGFYVTRKVFNVAKGPIKHALDLDDAGVADLFTTYLVTYALGQFLSAWLSKRMSNRTQLLLGMTTSVLCNLALGFLLSMGAKATPAIYVVLGVHGFAQATGWPCNVGLMARWTHRDERGGVMAIWATCYQLGSAFAKLFASFFLGLVGLSGSFYATSAALAVVVVAFYALAKERPEDVGLEPMRDDVDTARDQSPRRALTSSQQTALVVAMGVIYFAFKFVRYALDDWSALILGEHFKMDPETAGYLSSAFDWIGFPGVLAAGFASDRIFKGSRLTTIAVMTVGCVIVTSMMYGIGLSSSYAFVILLGLVGFMVMGPDSLLSGAGAMDSGTREQATRAAGIINGCGAVGPVVQELLNGRLRTYGDDVIFLILVVLMVLAAIGVFAFRATLKRMQIKL